MPRFDISIAGEINLDLILYGLPEHMPTERELLGTGFAMTLGSSSAILAHNLSVLGTNTGFITKVGDDALGKLSLDRLQESGVDLSRAVHAQNRGSGVTIILPHERERHILTYPGTISELSYEDLDLSYLASARHFHLSSLFLHRAMLPRIPELFRRMKEAGLTTSLDTNDDPDDRWGGVLGQTLPYVDILLPNEREARKMAGTEEFEAAVETLSKKVSMLVVKLGATGAIAIRDGIRYSAPAVPVKVVDPVGAGDSFNAGFLHKFLQGEDLSSCLAFAKLIGGFSTTATGGTEAFRDRAALAKFLQTAIVASETTTSLVKGE
jgi:sugar/nucleoside kinase (ribokinase family)